jgi:hypothetical protein
MKSSTFFGIGVAIDGIALLLMLSNLAMMNSTFKGVGGVETSASDGLTTAGQIANWILPLVVALFVGVGFWLRSQGKMAAANILVWIPATPMLVGLLIWAFLALLFLVAG